MADIQANIGIGVDTSQALAAIRQLQREISAFHTSMAKGGALASANSARLSQNLVNTINATGQFSAGMTRIQSSTESFTSALEKNKLSMNQYFRFAGGASRSFGKMFSKEFSTINQVATERVKDLQTQYISMGRDAGGALQAIKVRPLALDMDNLGTRVQMVAQKQQLFNQLLKQGSTNLLNFGKNTQWAGRQLMVGFTIPLTIFGGIAIKEFQKIEDQVVKFRRVYGDMFNTDAETEKALSNIRELAEEFTKYGIAVEKTIGLAAKVAQMGNVGTDLTEQVTQATRLAILGGLEQEEALETTISLTNAFGIAAEDLAGKIAFLNAAENQTILAIEDFNTAIPLSGSVVRQLGGDVEDLAVLLTAMREGGINASQAGNALKSSLGRLIAPSRNAKETLSGFGIDVMGIVEQNAGNLMGTINTLAVSLNELDPLSRARSIEALFGKFQFARMSTLFSNIIRDGSQANKVLGLTTATTEELAIIANRELSKVEQSPAFKLQKQMEALKASLAPIGEEFVKAIGPLIEFGTRLLKSFNNLGEGGKQFVVILTALAGVVAPAVLMVVGLVANGIANLVKFVALLGRGFAKLSGSSRILGTGTEYMTQQQIEAAAVAASLGQSHSNLIQVFTAEASAVRNLAAAYRQAIVAQSGFRGGAAGVGGRPTGPAPKKYNRGVTMVPGPKGAGDIIPAMLSPGEAVIPATQAQKYSGFIQSIISDNVPGYRRGVFLGMPKSSKQVKSEREASSLIASRYVKDSKVPVTDYGHQISPTTGRSFPISGVGGAYSKADGSKVFVKPFVDKQSAVAEMRSGQIARDVHGLLAPKHTLVQMRDPTDRSGKRLFYALESKLDPTFANPTGRFTKGEMVKQLLASLVRADKDLSPGNMYGRVLTDPGPGGVYSRASGYRNMAKPGELPSLAQQAEINLLGVKGGARKFFAQSTSDIARSMTPKEYQQMMLKEINTTLPKLRKTIDSFNLTGPEKLIYEDMLTRLEAGKNVDWTQFHTMHSNVPALPAAPMRLADGILSVPGPKGAGDVVPAMLSPGEAVIPAKQSRKHLSLIKGIVADNVPGYQDSNIGSVSFGDRSVPVLNQSVATTKAATRFSAMSEAVPGLDAAVGKSFKDASFSAASFKRALDEAGPALTGVIQLLQTTAEVMPTTHGDTGAIASHGQAPRKLSADEATTIANTLPAKSPTRQRLLEGAAAAPNRDGWAGNLYSEQVFTESGAGNKGYLTGQERASEWREDPLRSGAHMNESGFIDLGDPQQSADYSEFSGLVADGLEKAGTNAVTDSMFEEIIASALAQMTEGAAREGMERAGDTFRAVKTGTGDRPKARHGMGKGSQVISENGELVTQTGLKTSTADYQSVSGPVREKHSASLDAHTKKVAQKRATVAGVGEEIPVEVDESLVTQTKERMSTLGHAAADGIYEGGAEGLDARSPSRRMFGLGQDAADGLANGFEQRMADETGKTPLPGNLAAPKAPTPPPMAPLSRGAKLKNAVLDSAPSKFLGKKLAQASGVAITDTKGEVFYDPNKDPDSVFGQMEAKAAADRAKLPGGSNYSPDIPDLPNVAGGAPLPVRVVDGFEMDPQFQETMERGQIETESLSETLGKNVETTEQNTRTTKEVAKTDKRQKRMAVAGKTMGALGGLTMAAGMATQAPGVIGETAQKLVGPLGALTAALPMLIGLGPIFGTLALVIGAGVAAWMLYNNKLKEVTENARKLAENLGSGSKAMGVFAEAAGTATATEIMNRKRQLGSIDVAIGKSEFGESFMASDEGKAYVEEVEKGFEELGKSETIKKLGAQLSTAVISGVLTTEQAAGIASELGRTIGDTSVSIGILGSLAELIGPGGEDILTNPLEVKMRVLQVSAEGTFGEGGTVQDLMSSITDPENVKGIRGFIDAMFTTPELQAQLAGELVALAGQRQELLDADQVAFDKRIASLKEEESILRQQGKTDEADQKLSEIGTVTEEFWKNRQSFLQQSNATLSGITDQYSQIAGFQQRISDIGNINTFTGRDGDIEDVRQLLIDYQNFSGADFGINLATADANELRNAFKKIDTGELDKIGESLEGTLDQIGELVKSNFEDSSDAVKTTVANLVKAINDETRGMSVDLRLNLLTGLQTGTFDVGQVKDFVQKYVADAGDVTDDAVEDYRKNRERTRRGPGKTDEEIAERIAAEGRQMQENFNAVVDGLGPGAGQQLFSIFEKVEDTTERLLSNNLADAINIGTPEAIEDATNLLDVMSGIATYGEGTIDVDAAISVLVKNPEALADFNSKMKTMDALLSEYGEDLTAEVTFGAIFETDSAGFNALNSQAEYFNGLPSSQQKLFVSTFVTQFITGMESIGTAEGKATTSEFRKKEIAGLGNRDTDGNIERIMSMTDEEVFAEIARRAAERVTNALIAAGVIDGLEIEPTGSGGGAEPQIDSLLKKLRDLRDGTVEMKKGWEGMQKVLSSIFAGGTKELNIFDGLEKQLRDLNLGENLIAMIVGMDPDEFEKRKAELFNIDGTATAALINMNKAFDAVAIGDYVNGQEKFIQKTNNQHSAITTLIAAGLSLAEAYEAVQDEALAAAIAQGGTADEVARIVQLTKQITELKEKDAKKQERIRIAEAVQKTNEEFEKRVQIYQKLSRELENYTDAQIDAILNDSNIGNIFLDPTIDAGALTKALADAERKADLELRIRKLTVEGKKGVFEEGFGQAMDAFSRQEQAIELKFKAETSGDDEVLKKANEDIAAIQYKLDDYNAELERISWQEEEINDSYEKRFEALDNIADANERIAKAQESQLDIADALSKGDIAAAARAVASLRSQQAKDASKTQREMLEDAQKRQIEGLRSASGLSRKEIEDRAEQLERQIFNIEQINKRPAEERIRLATSIKNSEIEALTVLEKTREEWDRIKSGIDMAEQSGYKFKEIMQEALDVVKDLMEAYPKIKPAPPAPPAPVATVDSGPSIVIRPTNAQWSAWRESMGLSVAEATKQGGGPQRYLAGGGMIIPKRMAMGGVATRSRSAPPLQMAMGGRVKGYPMGGLIPYKNDGGFFKPLGSDTIPAMLTPGEFVIRRPAVRGFGLENLEKINSGTYNDGSVYNYNLAVNVKSDSDPNKIARAVITNIKSIENQRVRGNKL